MLAITWALLTTAPAPYVQTVTGPVAPAELGPALIHEHVLVDFAGADVASPDRYDADEVFVVMRPYLDRVAAAGIQTLFECTPKHLGRDPALLRRLSEATGVRLVTNTGLYMGKFLPDWATTADMQTLADDWIGEARRGLDGTDIRPGFIKIAVDGPPISEVQQRIVRAAARTSLATGLPIVMHCPPAASALQALDLLADEGLPARRLIVAHADAEADRALTWQIAARGAWLSFDGIREGVAEAKLEQVEAAWQRYPDQLLISQDAGWYSVGEPNGGDVAPLHWLPMQFVPQLERRLGDSIRHQLLVANPARALCVEP